MSQAIPLAIVSPLEAYNLELETRPKFFALNIFWIKLSDFMDIVPRHSHLTGLKLTTRDFVLDWPISEGAMMQNHQGIKEEAGASPPSVNGVNGTLVNGHR